MKKIRQLYWRMRDAGKRNQVIVFGVLSCVFAISIFAFLLCGMLQGQGIRADRENQIQETSELATDEATLQSEVTEEETSSMMEKESVFGFQMETEKDTVNTEGLSSYSAFMPDSVCKTLEERVAEICRKRGADSARKLNYQQTDENTYDVTSYILLSEGNVCKCAYNLRSNVLEVVETNYLEKDISAMEEAENRAEAERLKAQQEAERQKALKKEAEKKASQKKKVEGKKSEKTKNVGKKSKGKTK